LFVEIAPVLTLLIGALLILGGGLLARRAGLIETLGCGAALCILAVVLWLSPDTWRALWAGGGGGDRLLTYARLVGLTGLLFLAGTRFQSRTIRKGELAFFGIFGVLFFAVITLLLIFFVNQSTGTATLIAAAVVSSSLWFPAQLRMFELEEGNPRRASTFPAAIILSVVSMLGLYFADVLGAIAIVRRGIFAYLIVTLYELLKVALVFAFAYFISSRFLTKADGRISSIRTTIGFTLISILFFALVSLAVGQLGAMAWAFFAGALWRQTDIGDGFSKHRSPIASAMLLSFVFMSLPLQSHGRQLSWFIPILVIVIAAVAVKLCFAWLMLKRDSVRKDEALPLAASIAFPGELGILFLGFSISRWFVDASAFFLILVVAFASTLLIPLLCQVAVGKQTVPGQAKELTKRGLKAVF
jgi:Kef-type K+ transport system membrane component KefB